ncbi:aryl-sulfate sulfotransferase N-terminal domain-containing protein, partial [Vibrio natriegens]
TIDTTSPINVTEKDTDSSVFISDLDVGLDIDFLSSVSFTIQPMPGTFSKPIKATFTPDALTATESGFLLPVFGLYSGYDNQVTVDITLTDGSTRSVSTQITTSEYIDPNGSYD